MFLADLIRKGRPLRMVPILCGSIRGEVPSSSGAVASVASGTEGAGLVMPDGTPAPPSSMPSVPEPPAPEPPTVDGDKFLAALRDLAAERGDRLLLVAGADLAHVGPRFGDPGALNEEGLTYLEGQDRATLASVVDGDAVGFFHAVMKDGDPRRICGLSPVYALLAARPGLRGKLLCYEQASDPTGTVSYASVGLWE